ncbi:hypothetical protein [Streptomyces niveus]|uniref:hypothetical protein n=1 Tax=Streptomyces niveus TaxID=193462 RepID=UPI0034C61F28
MCADVPVLGDDHVGADVGEVAHVAVARDAGAGGDHDAVADDAVVGDVRARHDQAVVTDPGTARFGASPVDRRRFPDPVAVTDHQRGLNGAFRGAGLGGSPQTRERVHHVVVAGDGAFLDPDVADQPCSPPDPRVGADVAHRADNGVGMDTGIGVNHRGGVNHNHDQ